MQGHQVTFVMRGDAAGAADEWVEQGQIVGKVVAVDKNGRHIGIERRSTRALRFASRFTQLRRISRGLVNYLACALLLMLAALPARAQNLVSNPGFENTTLPPWTLAPGGPYDKVCKVGTVIGAATCIVHSGSYALSFGLNGKTDTLSQTITTVSGNL